MKKSMVTVFIFSLLLFSCENLFHDDIDGLSGGDISAPSNVTASKGTSTSLITVSWNSVTDIEYYEVWRSTSYTGTYTRVTTTTSTSFGDTSTATCTTYFYKITAVNESGRKSSMSLSDYGYRENSTMTCSGGSSGGGDTGGDDPTIDPPANVTASDGTNNSMVTIEWSTVTNAVRYEIYRSTSLSGTYSWIAEDDTMLNRHFDFEVDDCTIYYYKVKAIDSGGTSSDFSSANSGYGEIVGPDTCGF